MNKSITPETEANFKLSIDRFLHDIYPFLSEFDNQINQIERSLINNDSQLKDKYQIELGEKLTDEKNLTEYIMLLNILALDMSVIINLFLNGKSDYEKLFALKQGNVIINEGYKKIFSFVTKNIDGSINNTQREKSFWYRDICLLAQRFPKLHSKFETITKQLEDYFTSSFDTIKEIRDLTVHYDREPKKFYQMLISLDAETIFVKLKDFLQIIDEMNSIVLSILYKIKNEA